MDARPHSAPIVRTRQPQPPQHERPQSAVQDRLGRDLDTRRRRILRLEEKLRKAKETVQAQQRDKAQGFIRRSGDGAQTRYDGWVIMNATDAGKMDHMQEQMRFEPNITRRGANKMPSVHDPSFAQKGDQAVRSVYGRMIPVRPPSPERKQTPCWQHRRPNEKIRAILQTQRTPNRNADDPRRFRAAPETPAYRVAPLKHGVDGKRAQASENSGYATSTAIAFGDPAVQASGNAKLDRRDYHPSQHGTGRSVGIIKSSAWDGGPPSRERAAEIATPGYYPFGAGTVLMGSMPTEELSRLFRMYNGRVPPPIRRGATSL